MEAQASNAVATATDKTAARLGWRQRWRRLKSRVPALPPSWRRHPLMLLAIVVMTVGVLYWSVLASDRYVSEAHVIIQHTDSAVAGPADFAGLLGNLGGGSRTEQLQLRDYLLSSDLLRTINGRLKLKQHYADSSHDLISRLWSADAPHEVFHAYVQRRISVEFDDYSGVLVIKAQAYDARTAHAITQAMVQEGERYMNEMMHRLARSQVDFLEKQVQQQGERADAARQRLLDYQNRHGLVSPQLAVEGLNSLISRLEGQIADLQTRRSGLTSYLAADSAAVAEIDAQVGALRAQIKQAQGKLTAASGQGLNRNMDEFQRLQRDAQFTADLYQTALLSLEKGRIEATRTMKKVSVLQSPSRPEYAEEPRRFYNGLLTILITLALAGMAQLLLAIIRDHRD